MSWEKLAFELSDLRVAAVAKRCQIAVQAELIASSSDNHMAVFEPNFQDGESGIVFVFQLLET